MSEKAATQIVPHLCCRNAVEAAEFYQKAFGAEILGLFKMPDGTTLMHGALSIGGAPIYLTDEKCGHGAVSPLTLGNSPVTIHLQVPDSDAVYNRAVAAGCQVKMPLDDMFWGDRYGMVEDPYGHKWSIATTIRKVSQEELEHAVAAMS